MKKLKKKTVAVVITTLSTTTLINNKQVEAHAIPYKNNEVSLSANTSNNNTQFMYLSDIGYMSNLSHTAWGGIKLDQTLEGGTIKLNVDGEALEFNKGITAHATSTVVFDVSHYSNQYSRFTTYVGVDKSQGDRGNGVKFKVLTSVDGQNWEEKFETDVLKGNDHAVFIDIDITGANYLKLYADDNGSNGNDHSVYAAPRIMVPDYDISSEYLQGVKSVSDYDKIIREKYNESHQLTDEIKELVLKRTLTQRVGFYTLQKLIAKSDDHKNTITWLLNHPHVLELYIMGGEIEKSGSYVQSMDVLTQLYHEYKDDFEDPVNGEFYLKLALSLSLSHAQTIRLWTGNATPSDAVERYKIYKENYLNGRIAEGGDAKLFKNLPIELMRWVTDNKIDDEEINWLIDTALARKVNGKNHLDAYEYIEYTDGYNYNDEKFYLEENYEMWNNKYNISSLTGYGQRGVHKIWMVFEDGSVCGGLAKTYANLGQVFGIPSAGIGQPGHGATLSYRENSNGQGTWVIQNDISGFRESEKGERLLLGWGSKTSKWVSYFNVSYVLLAQHALNHYADYITASYYNLLAKSYESEPTKQEEIYEKALQVQNYNLDTLVGLIETYNKVDSKTSADYLRLAQKVANGLTYFPLPFVDLMNLVEPFMTDDTDKVVFDMLRTTTLQRATQATASDSTQPNECISVAKYLLGDYTTELASFSFDGENAGKIKIDEAYANSNIRWEYSLDNWQTKKETGDKEVTLSEKELQQINATDDIQISLVGTSEIYTIDITEQQTPNIYVNDLENQIKGAIVPLEYSEDGGQTWTLYEDERLTGNRTLKIRYRASGTALQSEMTDCQFTEDVEQADRTYIPLENVSLYLYSSQNNDTEHAAINMLDGNIYTGWHNSFSGEKDKYYSVQFNQPKYLTSIDYFGDGGNGKLKDVDIYTSMDGVNWEKNTEIRHLPNTNGWKTLNLNEPTLTKYVMFHAVSTHGARPNEFVSGRMFNFFEDTTKEVEPQVSVNYNIEQLTNQDVLATLQLPEGYTVIGEATHLFTQNGSYTFTYQSPTGKQFTYEATVDWIDKVAPTATISYNCEQKTNQNVTATVMSDEEITVENNNGESTYEFTENGEFTFIIKDKAGNRSEFTAKVTWINKEKPILDVTYSTMESTTQPVTATLITEDVQVKAINGKEITVTNNDGSASYVFTENGEFTFEYVDDYGNEGTTTAKVDWIVADTVNDCFIPDEIVDLINLDLLIPVMGNATADAPLHFNINALATVDDLSQMIDNMLDRYTLKVSVLEVENGLCYALELSNGHETYYFVFHVKSEQTAILDYLDSLVENSNQPENPGQPSEPEQPENPGQPSEPEQPENPGQPGEPEQPENPGQTSEPEQPENPGQPSEPEQPENPGQPGEPEQPENPGQPGEPEQPENPGQPGEPEQPENPGQPGEPEQPENPGQPGESEQPENPGQPGEPEQSENQDQGMPPKTGLNGAIGLAGALSIISGLIGMKGRKNKRRG